VAHHHRICANFQPNEHYLKSFVSELFTLARSFARFGIDFEPGVLYEFYYHRPSAITKLAVLRLPNYQSGGWTKAKVEGKEAGDGRVGDSPQDG
jgi:hypothetical protein